MVKIDILNFVLGIYLVQKHLDRWHPVIYYSCKMTLLKLKYNIYNKELLGIIAVLKEWRAFLQETIEPFIVKTDYKNLIGFLTTKELNRR